MARVVDSRTDPNPVQPSGTGQSRLPKSHPPRVGLGSALVRYPMVVLLPVIVLIASGVTLGIRRHQTYSASTQLNVGVPDANSQATPGYAQAAQQLASSYSLQATSKQVFAAVATRVHLSAAEVKSRVSTDTVPTSSIFYINATGPTAADATRLSTTTARVLQMVVDQSKKNTGPGPILTNYRRLQNRANSLANAFGKLKGAKAGGSTSVSQTQIDNAQIASQLAQLQAQAQAQRYSSAVAQSASPNLDILNPARSASSNRRTYVERYGLIGLAAGLVIGAALAFIVARLSARRRLRTA